MPYGNNIQVINVGTLLGKCAMNVTDMWRLLLKMNEKERKGKYGIV